MWINTNTGDTYYYVRVAEETSAKRLGEKIRKIRKENGLNQTELGEKVNLSADRIQKYENGARRPKAETMVEIAEALGVNPLVFIDQPLSSEVSAMFAFFELENRYNLTPVKIDDEYYLSVGNGFQDLSKSFSEWYERYNRYCEEMKDASTDEMKEKITRDYHFWEWNYPKSAADEGEKHREQKRLEERIAELQGQLEKLKEDK